MSKLATLWYETNTGYRRDPDPGGGFWIGRVFKSGSWHAIPEDGPIAYGLCTTPEEGRCKVDAVLRADGWTLPNDDVEAYAP